MSCRLEQTQAGAYQLYDVSGTRAPGDLSEFKPGSGSNTGSRVTGFKAIYRVV